MSDDGKCVISASGGGTVRLWDPKTGNCLGTLEGYGSSDYTVAISADGRIALSGCSDKTVKVWDLETKRRLATFEGHTDHVTVVAMSRDARYAISRSYDKTARVWDIKKMAIAWQYSRITLLESLALPLTVMRK